MEGECVAKISTAWNRGDLCPICWGARNYVCQQKAAFAKKAGVAFRFLWYLSVGEGSPLPKQKIAKAPTEAVEAFPLPLLLGEGVTAGDGEGYFFPLRTL